MRVKLKSKLIAIWTAHGRADHHPGPNRVAAAARKVGGYSALIRLSKQRHAIGPGSVLKRDPKTGEWSYRKPD